jgi:hypothetical protein
MLPVSPHFAQQAVEAVDGQVIFVFVANRQGRADRRPMLF